MNPLPLLLAFTLSAVAADASWLRYPAISPDGKTIVFSHAGDLFTVPSEGGKATLLTRHVAYDYRPVWSPDSRWIAFASDRYGNDDVYLVAATGGKETRLTVHSAGDRPTAFTPDGKSVVFSSTRMDAPQSLQMPYRSMSELYSVPVDGGRVRQLLTTAAHEAVLDSKGKRLLYQDFKGYEDPWRKHHVSSVARDIWLHDLNSGKHSKLTTFPGEDRDPIWGKGDEYFYLSEKSGSFNVWQGKLGGKARQLTKFEHHPVRFLSRADGGTLCFGYHGRLMTLSPGGESREVKVELTMGAQGNEESTIPAGPITEIALSPNGKELAFIARGEVFVTSLEHKATKRITNTPEQERSLSFHPEGRALLYASERNGSWNLFETTLADEEEKAFHLATALDERAVLEIEAEAFQPRYSPDGKSIAYLEEREKLMVLDVESGERREILGSARNYSYSDGDIEYAWAPDGKWLVATFLPEDRWINDLCLLKADGEGGPINITLNGYNDFYPQWAMGGDAIVWLSNRNGRRSHGSWGSDDDVFAVFLNEKAHRDFRKPEVEREQDERPKKEDTEDEENGDEENGDDEEEKDEEPDAVEIDLEDLEERVERLTRVSSEINGVQVSPDGETMYYLERVSGKHLLWKRGMFDDDRDLLATLSSSGRSATDMVISDDGKHLVLLLGGEIRKIETKSGKSSGVGYSAMMERDVVAERAHLFEHVWRQTAKKFHRSDMHGVDWEFYRKEYEPLLAHIHHTRDFCELLSEMLGELNASHTGAKFRPQRSGGSTGSLGIFHDWAHDGAGVRILDLVPHGPLAHAERPPKPGTIIERINGEEIAADRNHFKLLWRQSGQRVRLAFHDPASDERWEEVVRPISPGAEQGLLYDRWVERMRDETERLSDGRIGYMHVRGMSDGPFREFFGQVFGRHAHRKALVVDTRFNGGGWLTEDLTTFLSGQQYLMFYPREKGGFGGQPIFRWSKPSVVLMSEGNYSDAHMFPFAYKDLGIGKLVGMPVPGTATAVWWERLMDPEIVFGIPQVSMISRDGKYLENTQLKPDIPVENPKEDGAVARDRQLEAAVKHLLALPDPEPWPEP